MTCSRKSNGDGTFSCEPCGLDDITGDLDLQCRRKHECAVCQGEAFEIHIGRFRVCEDPRCAEVAKVWLVREPDGSTHWEREAMRAGGKAGGLYLQHEVKATDLRKLTKDQYAEYVRRVVTGYRNELRRQGHFCAPPF